MNPLISVCIPAYKRVEGMKRLLRSLQEQHFSDFEIIISDDSPDDAIEQLIKEFASLPIHYHRNIPAAGTPANWNTCLQKANGEWIKMMHDDDWFASPDALDKFADAAIKSGADFIFSACKNIYFERKIETKELLHGWRKDLLYENTLNLFFLNVIGHPSVIMHKKDNEILYDEQFKWVVDVDFYTRYLEQHRRFHYIPEMLVSIGIDESQVTNDCYKNPFVEIPEYLRMLSKFQPNLLLKHQYVFYCVWELVRKFSLRSTVDIRKYGYEGILPDKTEQIIQYQKKIPNIILKQTPWNKKWMQRCFNKLRVPN